MIKTTGTLLLLFGAGLALFGCGASDGTTGTSSGRSVTGTLLVGGTERSYKLYIPTAADTSSADLPLVLTFHAVPGSGDGAELTTGFNTYAEQFGFLVAYPSSLEADWAEDCDCSQADLAGVNDTGFVRLLIADLDDRYSVDRSRVYAVGQAGGGIFTWRLACQLTDEFAAVASVSGPMSVPVSETCNPAVPIAVLDIQGTADAVYPFEGGGDGGRAVLGAEETVQMWASWNGCPATPEVTQPPDNFDDGTFVTVHRYAPCDAGTETIMIGVTGGRHAWAISQEFNTALTIAGFLLLHQR